MTTDKDLQDFNLGQAGVVTGSVFNEMGLLNWRGRSSGGSAGEGFFFLVLLAFVAWQLEQMLWYYNLIYRATKWTIIYSWSANNMDNVPLLAAIFLATQIPLCAAVWMYYHPRGRLGVWVRPLVCAIVSPLLLAAAILIGMGLTLFEGVRDRQVLHWLHSNIFRYLLGARHAETPLLGMDANMNVPGYAAIGSIVIAGFLFIIWMFRLLKRAVLARQQTVH
ncbi:MAG: hypothetical protein H6843_10805 [Rhodospirillaceae bacterium]|nr:hypothetical protein [Rhodospirillaceae bacterium]